MRTITTALAAAVLVTSASALPIVGDVQFSGFGNLNGPVATATQLTVSSAFVIAATGDYSPTLVPGVTPATFTSPLVFGSNPGLIWTSGPFTFTSTSPIAYTPNIPANTGSFVVDGLVDDGAGPGDPTFGTLTLTILPGSTALRGFVSITSSVPDAGSTVALLGAGCMALGLVGWRRSR